MRKLVAYCLIFLTCSSGNTGRHGTRGKVSRKEARKQGRGEKKQRRADYFATTAKRTAEHEHEESPKRKRARLSEDAEGLRPSVQPAKVESQQRHQKPAVKPPQTNETQRADKRAGANPPTALQKLAHRTDHKRATVKLPRTKQEDGEDAYIAYLESKLGWTKAGSRTSQYGRGLEDDGLDGAYLRVCPVRLVLTRFARPTEGCGILGSIPIYIK